MKEEVDEETKKKFEKAEILLSLIFSICNILIIIASLFLLNSKNENNNKLKYKLFILIITDLISLIFYTYFYNDSNLFLREIFFSACTSIEFYFFLSFIYQIFFNTTVSKSPKEVELIKLNHLCFVFPFLIFSYYKFTSLYSQIINILQSIITVISLILLCNYIKKAIEIMTGNLISKDTKNHKIYNYLNILDTICLIVLSCYNLTNFIYISIENELYQLYLEIILNAINHSLKYFIYILFAIIIFTLNKNYYRSNNDEIVSILQKKNLINNI